MLKVNSEYIHELIERVNTSPFPQHLYMQLVAISLDSAKVELKAQKCHLQPFEIIHDGVLATLIDMTLKCSPMILRVFS